MREASSVEESCSLLYVGKETIGNVRGVLICAYMLVKLTVSLFHIEVVCTVRTEADWP